MGGKVIGSVCKLHALEEYRKLRRGEKPDPEKIEQGYSSRPITEEMLERIGMEGIKLRAEAEVTQIGPQGEDDYEGLSIPVYFKTMGLDDNLSEITICADQQSVSEIASLYGQPVKVTVSVEPLDDEDDDV